MKKKQFIMCLLVLLTSFSYAQNVFTDNFITYEVNDDTNSVTVTDYDTAGGTEVVIPSSVNNSSNTYSVSGIGSRAFRFNQLITVSIPNSVTSIEFGAFADNQLTSVSIPNSVTSIGANVFENNQLRSVSIPNSVTTIGREAFRDNQLTNVSIPNSVTSIGSFAFANNQLTSVSIPNSVTYIAGSVFENNQLTSVNIPNSVTSIGSYGFANNQLTNVSIPNRVTSIDREAFADNQLISVISDNINPPKIDISVFANNLEMELRIPDGTADCYIEAGWISFKNLKIGNSNLESLNFTNQGLDYTITSIDKNYVTLLGRNSENTITDITIPEEVIHNTNIYKVTKIGERAFHRQGLTSVTIPSSVNDIGRSAFANNQLTSITIPNSSVTIGLSAFSSNPLVNLTLEGQNPLEIIFKRFIIGSRLGDIDLVVPQGLINTYLEAGWVGFKSISDGTATLNNLSFTSQGFDYYINNTERNTVAILGKTDGNDVKELIIPESVTHNNISYMVTTIEEFAFNRKGLTKVTIPNSITSIGFRAFTSNQLTTVTIPNSITSIGQDTFSHNQLTSVTIPKSVTSIGRIAFSNNQLTSVSIPNSVTTINNNAFSNNQLTSVTIPNSVTIINNSVFSNNQLTTVNIQSEIPLDRRFNNIFGKHENIDLIVPQGFINTYLDAGWINFKSISDGSTTVNNLSFTSNGFNYMLNSATTNTVTILGKASENNNTEITIPETITHNNTVYTINKIGDAAFRTERLINVNIPRSITNIRRSAFSNNQLTNIDIPSSVTSIEESAFFNNDLTSVTIPENVTTIGRGAFDSNQITEVTSLSNNPASLLENNNSTFGKNSNIDLTIPNKTLSTYENNGWTGFKSVTESSVLSTEAFKKADNKINFKNPVASQLQIFTNAPVKLIKIYDMSGKKLLETTDIDNVTVANLQSGMYIIHFTTDKEVIAKRMLKE